MIPAPIYARLGVEKGDRLIFTINERSEVVITSAREQLKRLRGMYHREGRRTRVVDDLIAERRRESAREGKRR